MRIGISTSVIQRGKTGIAQYVFALLRGLLPFANKHEFYLFVLEEDLSLFNFIGDQMRLISVPEMHRPAVRNILWHQAWLPKLARDFHLDVLHVPSYRRLLWPRPCALVATIHDLAPFQVSNKYDWKRMFYGRVIARRLAGRQDRIVAISQNTAHDLVKFFRIPQKRISVVYNGIEHDRFCPGSLKDAHSFVARNYGLIQPYFLYVARLEYPAKNHVRLIQAFDMFKAQSNSKTRLVFGGSDWHGAEAIHAAIKNSAFSADIQVLGFVPDDFLPDLYRAARAFVYPSLYEGFGLPPVEAMACGCPVIASTRGSLGEVVGDAAQIIEPEEVSSIANALLLLELQDEVRSRLREAGLVRCQQFNWKITAAETLKVYENQRSVVSFPLEHPYSSRLD